jgi:hypothetical protein
VSSWSRWPAENQAGRTETEGLAAAEDLAEVEVKAAVAGDINQEQKRAAVRRNRNRKVLNSLISLEVLNYGIDAEKS